MNSQLHKQRGIALLIVMFALVLLSVIGLGMMYSTNMETAINGNYRDKQTAFYAAMAGLQEGRDRLGSSVADAIIPLPSGLPTLVSSGSSNVIYIVSDASVKPWDNSNPYFDTEFCQENVTSVTLTAGTAGVPCTGPYATSSQWYSVYNDSTSATWKLTNPLDWKWTRITLKANNMTPYAVNGTTTDGSQVCWDGTYEMSTPTGYSTGCHPVGPVGQINVINGGTNYTATAPTVTITSADGNGSGATAVAQVAATTTGVVASISMTTGGKYTSSTPPAVTICGIDTAGMNGCPSPGSGGSGATVTSVSMTAVTSETAMTIALGNAGTGYTTAPTVVISGGGGSGATATTTISTSGALSGFASFTPGTQCYTSPPIVTISGGGATTAATAHTTLDATSDCIYSWTYTGASPPNCTNKLDNGNGYNPRDTSTTTFISPQNGSTAFSGYVNVVSNSSGGNTADKTLLSSGCCTVTNPGYDTTHWLSNFNTTLSLTGGGASTDCAVTVAVTVGKRLNSGSLALDSGGSGYTSTPMVSIAAGSGTGATAPSATASTVTVGQITTITLNNQGTGYTSNPTVTICGTDTTSVAGCPNPATSGGSGGTATATVSTQTTYSVQMLTYTAAMGGSGYDPNNPPTVMFSGANQSIPAQATSSATVLTTGYQVSLITVCMTCGGQGYTSDPIVTICGSDTAGGTIRQSTGAVVSNGCPVGSGPGTGATATSIISGGTHYGQVFLVTSFAQTSKGARSMVQMEVATPIVGWNPGGALTLDGPLGSQPSMPSSSNFGISGMDMPSCGSPAEPNHPAIDGYDDPNNPTNPTSVSQITNAISQQNASNYSGAGGTPSVENGYGGLGPTMTDPVGLWNIISDIDGVATNRYVGNQSSVAFGNCPNGWGSTGCLPVTDYVDGNLSLSGNVQGYGILVVTGTLTFSGNFSWHGVVLIIGDGVMQDNGGGNKEFYGTILVAKIWAPTCGGTPEGNRQIPLCTSLQSPTFNWNGGGTNFIQYDSCWATGMMDTVPWSSFSTGKVAKIVSFRILPY